MRIIEDVKLDFNDVLIVPKRSTLKSRSDVSLERTFKFKHSQVEWSGIPIIAANMDGVGTISMANVLSQHKLMTALHKHYDIHQLSKFFKESSNNDFTFYSMGILQSDLDKLISVLELTNSDQLKYICVDAANGYTEQFVDSIKRLRDTYPTKTILAGNVVTPEMTEELILAGADIIKIGIGSGQMCTTRLVAGIGYPQLSAVVECADAAHGLGGHICSDGGCTTPADIVKAFAGGADFVMLGSMLAGHNESEGEIIGTTVSFIGSTLSKLPVLRNDNHYIVVVGDTQYDIPGRDLCIMKEHPVTTMSDPLYKRYPGLYSLDTPDDAKIQFYGMSSSTAMKKHNGGVAEYRSSEGRTVEIPYRGFVRPTINHILGGVRSACTYTGSTKLKELTKRATFVRVNNTHNNTYDNNTTTVR
jgi:GMP reductase